jgi:hypothetical protein
MGKMGSLLFVRHMHCYFLYYYCADYSHAGQSKAFRDRVWDNGGTTKLGIRTVSFNSRGDKIN